MRGHTMAGDWSAAEVELAVDDYVAMLEAELRAQSFVKVEHYKTVQPLLEDRSVKAIEWKYRNISAAFLDLGSRYVTGLKPAFNYQELVLDVVEERLRSDRELAQLVKADVEQPSGPPEVEDILSTLVDPPPPRGRPNHTYEGSRTSTPPRIVDYLAIEARNSALGLEGERFVLTYERARLVHAGKPSLADSIEHTSVEEGDGAGFDIRSYETDGSDRFIEVKTTKGGIYTPVYLSRKELRVSEDKGGRYHLFRPFEFRKTPKLFTVAGALSETLRLEPTQYMGRIR